MVSLEGTFKSPLSVMAGCNNGSCLESSFATYIKVGSLTRKEDVEARLMNYVTRGVFTAEQVRKILKELIPYLKQ